MSKVRRVNDDLITTDAGLAEAEAVMAELARNDAPDLAATIVLDHLQSGGKRLRARLALAATQAFGKPRSDAYGWAAACEMLHNATLIHDDLQDGDRVRRGHPTTWVTFGSAQAINAGDLLFVLPTLAIGRCPADQATKWRLCVILARQAAQVIRGQIDELEMTTRADATWPAYDRAIIGKTSALFELPVEGAAVIAGMSDAEAAKVTKPFRALGKLFQMQDDVLDLFGDKGRDARGSDIKEGKVSALVVEHITRHPQDRDWLIGFLKTPRDQTSQANVDEVIAKMEKGGALKGVCDRIHEESDKAASASELENHPKIVELMHQLTNVIVAPIKQLMQR